MLRHSPLFRVIFICRGSNKDGLGHVMRSRTVASAMARRTTVKMVIIGDQYVDSLLFGRGIDYSIVPDEAGVVEVLESYQPNVVIFDLMSFSEARFAGIQASAMRVSLSPIFNCLGKVDILFNRTTYLSEDWQPQGKKPVLRCGLQYSVVRENCVPIPTELYEQNLLANPLSVVISMGGTDAANKTLRVLNSVKSVPGRMLFWVLLGEGYAHSYQTLVEAVKQDTRHEIILAKTSDSMWRIMKTCTLAILAAGTITYEAAYAGLPSINVFESDEHLFLVSELIERGVCLSAGYPFADALSVINANITHLDRSRGELFEMHRLTQGLIDGKGASRIANEIEEFYWQEFLPRQSSHLADAQTLQSAIL